MKYAIRSQIIPEDGHVFVALDLAQAESWVVAYKSSDQRMLKALEAKVFHETTASAIFGKPIELITKEERYSGKKTNHSTAYRQSAGGLQIAINGESDETGITVSLSSTKYYNDAWHKLYSVKEWWKEIDRMLDGSRTLTTVYGFTRTFYGVMNDDLKRVATAMEPQSTVADHTFGAIQPELGVSGGLISINDHFANSDIKVVHTGHDSIMVDCPYSSRIEVAHICYNYLYRPLAINGHKFYIPVDVEIGERWGELEKVKF